MVENIMSRRCQASNRFDFRDQINVHSSVNYEASYKLQSWKMGPAASELCLEDSKKCETWPSLTLVSTTFKSFKNAVFQSRIVITRLYMLQLWRFSTKTITLSISWSSLMLAWSQHKDDKSIVKPISKRQHRLESINVALLIIKSLFPCLGSLRHGLRYEARPHAVSIKNAI